MRLIDADAFIKENAEIIDCEIDHPKYQDTLRELIDEAPTIIYCGEMDHETLGKIPYMDLRPRPHGEWEHWGSPFSDDSIANSIVCSLCKTRYVEIDGEVFNFCPNCGASMQANDRQVTGKLNSEIEKLKSEIVPDYRDGWRKRGEAE